MLKPKENPPIRPRSVASVAELPGLWWLAQTKARFEKALAWDLLHRDIHYFLPLIQRTVISGGKKRRVYLPLFSSYVFINGDGETRHNALTTNRISQIIPVTDRVRFVNEIAAIERTIESDLPMDVYPSIAVGTRCRVRQGALLGIEGTIIRRDNIERFVIGVSFLGQGVMVDIAPDLLEVVE